MESIQDQFLERYFLSQCLLFISKLTKRRARSHPKLLPLSYTGHFHCTVLQAERHRFSSGQSGLDVPSVITHGPRPLRTHFFLCLSGRREMYESFAVRQRSEQIMILVSSQLFDPCQSGSHWAEIVTNVRCLAFRQQTTELFRYPNKYVSSASKPRPGLGNHC